MGPTIIEVNKNLTAYKEEIFGPALCIVYVDSLQEGIELINRFLFNYDKQINLLINSATIGAMVPQFSPEVAPMPENSNMR